MLPSEIRPLVASLNNLFGKVGRLLHHERTITAFAAHEIAYPSSGLANASPDCHGRT